MRHLFKLMILLAGIAAGILLLAQDGAPDSQQDPTPDTAPDNSQPAPDSPDAQTDSANAAAGMTLERLDELLRLLDEELAQQGPSWQFQFRDRVLIVVADGNADRMRIMSPVAESAGLDQAELYRLLQANFDSALDARYAVAQDTLWSVFIHPLSPLTERQLASAIFQVYNTAATFGTVYSSGELTYGGGDSNDELRELQEELERRLRPRT